MKCSYRYISIVQISIKVLLCGR